MRAEQLFELIKEKKLVKIMYSQIKSVDTQELDDFKMKIVEMVRNSQQIWSKS